MNDGGAVTEIVLRVEVRQWCPDPGSHESLRSSNRLEVSAMRTSKLPECQGSL